MKKVFGIALLALCIVVCSSCKLNTIRDLDSAMGALNTATSLDAQITGDAEFESEGQTITGHEIRKYNIFADPYKKKEIRTVLYSNGTKDEYTFYEILKNGKVHKYSDINGVEGESNQVRKEWFIDQLMINIVNKELIEDKDGYKKYKVTVSGKAFDGFLLSPTLAAYFNLIDHVDTTGTISFDSKGNVTMSFDLLDVINKDYEELNKLRPSEYKKYHKLTISVEITNINNTTNFDIPKELLNLD